MHPSNRLKGFFGFGGGCTTFNQVAHKSQLSASLSKAFFEQRGQSPWNNNCIRLEDIGWELPRTRYHFPLGWIIERLLRVFQPLFRCRGGKNQPITVSEEPYHHASMP